MPPYNGVSRSIVHRKRRLSDRKPNSDENYDAELGVVRRVSNGRQPPSMATSLESLWGLPYRCFDLVRGSRLSYKDARRVRRVEISFIVLVTLFALDLLYVMILSAPPHKALRPQSDDHLEQVPVLLRLFNKESQSPFPTFHSLENLESEGPSYGGLVFASLKDAPSEEFRRRINTYREVEHEMGRTSEMLGPLNATHENEEGFCKYPGWIYDYFPNCNNFHEVDLGRTRDEVSRANRPDYDIRLFGNGYFRDGWMLRTQAKGSLVLKTLRYYRDFDLSDFKNTQKDALVMEKLTASPRIVDIYGHCSTSVTVEAMDDGLEGYIVPGTGYIQQEELDKQQHDDVRPQNNLTDTERVELALEMAEAIADLHGYEGGVIVHDDVQPCQWMRSKDGKIKLGDFNRAEVLGWDEEQQKYCIFYKYGAGSYRSPEEFAETEANEKIDVYSMGNNIYVLLTGLWNFYTIEDWDAVQDKVINGDLPFLDDRYRNRTFVDSKLVEIMEKCWVYDPSERIDIFEVVELLRHVLAEHHERMAQTKS